MATMKKMIAKKAAKKYEDGGPVTTTSETTKKPVKTAKKSKTISQALGDITLRDVKNAGETALNLSTLGGYGVAKKKVKELMNKKSGGTVKKYKAGGSIKKAQSGLGMKSVKSGYDNNSGVTRADFVAIGKGTAKSGAKMKMGGKMAKQAATAIAMKKAGKAPKATMKSGGKMTKCKYGCK